MKRKRWSARLSATLFLIPLLPVFVLPAEGQQIAFTWDDLPVHGALPPGETRVQIGREIIAAMKEAHLPPAYGFVNGLRAEKEPLSGPMLRDWHDAGLPLDNHTWSHMNLNERPLSEWEEDVVKNEDTLKPYIRNGEARWFRFPFLSEGDTPEKREGARKFLAGHGYRIAGVTMSFADYLFNEPYGRCVTQHNSAAIAQLEESYLAAAAATIDYTRAVAKLLYGHDIPYVLLMHVGALDARMLPRLLKLYRDKGFTFVSLEEAEQDPFYKNDLDLSLPPAPDTLEEAMRMRNLAVPEQPVPSMDLDKVCR